MSAVPKPAGRLMPFESEAHAVDYVVRALTPFCETIVREPEFKTPHGILRPDLGIRLRALPRTPLTIEVKQFEEGKLAPLPRAIAQASDYARLTGTPCFVAPLVGDGPLAFSARDTSVRGALLTAGEFNVGGLYFAGGPSREQRVGGLLLGGVQIALFTYNEWGDPDTTLHPNAAHLLKRKERKGSQAWRPS